MERKILISTSSYGKVDSKPLELLEQAGFEVTLNPYGSKLSISQSIELLAGQTALIAGTEKLNAEIFDAHPQLKYICRLGTGMDSVDLDEAKNRNIPVENTPNAHVDGVAELCLSGILDLHREVSFAHHNLKQGVWKKPMGSLLKGKTIGLIGLGKVAKRLVELLQPFNMKILAVDKYWDSDFAKQYNVEQVELDYLLQNSGIVSIHIPFSPENKNVISERELNLMNSSAILINTSRGGLINEVDLLTHLKANSMFKAYLDTYESEPYTGELLSLDNILLTPHIGSYAKEVRLNMEMECAEKIIAYFNK
ncbi:MAG: 3-phosphoglycerate dehydrogenase [Bacteroidetes bacterium]|nr:MAG: 3-phosphoglycerate dehydrogenase [Bacteroidota bacterium]